MLGLPLLLLLAAGDARADEPVLVKPAKIEPLKEHWFMVDGVPRKWDAIEGWLLTDPCSRPYVIRHGKMKFGGAALITAGTSALVIGLGFGFRDLNAPTASGQSSTVWDWIPAAGGAVLLAVGIPLLLESNHQERKAVEVYTGVLPQRDGASLSVSGTF